MFFYNFSLFFLFIFGFSLCFFFNDLFLIWLGMEVISIMILLYFLKDFIGFYNMFNKSKIIFKYFLIQIVSSAAILISLFFINYNNDFFLFVCFFFLCVKISSFPSHGYLIEFFHSLSYKEMFVLSVVPKLSSFFLFFFFLILCFFFLFLVFFLC